MKTEAIETFPTIPKYKIIAQLGMGMVYRGEDGNGKEVVVRIMPASTTTIATFRTHAERLQKLNHPNIPPVLDYGTTEQYFYLITPYLDGIQLSQILREQPNGVSAWDCLPIALSIAHALTQAHLRGISHFRLQPNNVLLTPATNDIDLYHVWLIDMGIDELLSNMDQEPDDRRPNIPAYTAPEKWQQTGFDSRVDLYSLGVMIYELLTGQYPFPIRSAFDVVRFHKTGQLVSVRAHVPRVPILLDVLVKKLLAGNPDRRPKSAEAVVSSLERILRAEKAFQLETPSIIQMRVASLATAVVTSKPDVTLPQPLGIRVLYHKQWDNRTYWLNEDEPLTVGRLLTAAITLVSAERFVSKQHCEISRRGDEVWVQDVGSTNGSLLGEGKMPANKPLLWQKGTFLRLGPFILTWDTTFADDMAKVKAEAGQLEETRVANHMTLFCPNAYPQRVEIGHVGQNPLRLGRALD
ncbi:MAG: protein kinase, partial [Methylococcales bacterium]|nr:protein kinase [Methylococcales bacterium]